MSKEHEHYRIVWVDSQIGNKENLIHIEVFQTLGYNLLAIDSIEAFQEFLKYDQTKDNIMVICSGASALELVPTVHQ